MSRSTNHFSRVAAWALVGLLALLVGCPQGPGKKEEKKDSKKTSSTDAKDQKKAGEKKTEAPKEEKADLPAPEKKPEVKKEEPKPEVKEEPKPEVKQEPKPEVKEEPKPEVKKEEPKAEEPKPEVKKEEPKPEVKKEEPKPESKPEAKTEVPKAEVSDAAKPLKKAELLVELPDNCNNPDGMAVLADESIILSVPNFNDKSAAPVLMKITKDNKVEEFLKLPEHPETKRMGPMGIRQAPSGDLYLGDNQLFHHKDPKQSLFGQSRVVRIAMKDGKPGEIVPVATGMNCANGIAIHDGYVYVTETILVPGSKPLVSGVFRFKIGEENVALKQPLKDDPHLLLTIETKSEVGFGADGICFDDRGNLYVSDFSDAVIYKVVLDPDGKVKSKDLFMKSDVVKSCDGMMFDPKTKKIYSADLMGNAIRVIDMDGKVQTLAQNGDTDGSGGLLDAPAEAVVRGNTVVVANFDFVVPGGVNTKFDKPYTLSVIKLE